MGVEHTVGRLGCVRLPFLADWETLKIETKSVGLAVSASAGDAGDGGPVVLGGRADDVFVEVGGQGRNPALIVGVANPIPAWESVSD